MAIDIVRGAFDKPASTKQLIKTLEKINLEEGVLYTGYPIIGSHEVSHSLDAVLIAPELGILLFDIIEEPEVSQREEIRDILFNAVVSRLINVKGLSGKRGQLAFDLNVVTYAPAWAIANENEEVIVSEEGLLKSLNKKSDVAVNKEKYETILASVQALTKLKTRPPRSVKSNTSKGAILNIIEKSIANLDKQQSKAVIETSNGIQRIRGLAGSGKTIILALKAAYLHSKYPDWKIGVTFYSRALKAQFKDFITKFTIEHKNEEPDFINKVKVMQAWGSPSDDGFYYQFCKLNGLDYHSWDSASAKYRTREDLIGKISSEALALVKEPKPDFDVILVDEAQDFSESFLKLCYNLLRSSDHNNSANRRLVYAYDELQKLNEVTLRSPKEIFGQQIDFENDPDQPVQDVILNKCYRNSSPVLVTAHSLGFGVDRKADEKVNLVTMFEEKELWRDIGYKVVGGRLEFGEEVTLARDKQTSPDLITQYIPVDDLIQFNRFNNYVDEYNWIAQEIKKNITEDELSPEDIIVIHPHALVTKSETPALRSILANMGINSHLVGVSTSRDAFFSSESIAFTSIYRAKGNEAAMIYVMNAEYCYSGRELITKRNTLFTAITRSKGWVRVCGVGSGMEGLCNEFNTLKSRKYKLKFRYPTEEEMEQLNVIHGDLTLEEKNEISKANEEVKILAEKLENNQLRIEDIAPETLEKLKRYFRDDHK